jgi:hypothetical protein
MRMNLSLDDIAHPIVDIVLRRDGKILHRAAELANEVIMLLHGPIISMDSFTEIELADFPLRCEDVKITVNCAKGYSGNLLSDLFVHPFCGGVRPCPLQDLEDLFSLTASLRSKPFHHRDSLGSQWRKSSKYIKTHR